MKVANDIALELQKNGIEPSGLSDTVQGVVKDLFSRGSLTAAAIANAILERHPEYCSGRAKGVEFREVGETLRVAEWIGRVRAFFDHNRAPQLHGRLVLIGLSHLDSNVSSQLFELGLMPALEKELKEPVEILIYRPPTDGGISSGSSGAETKAEAEAQAEEVEMHGEENVSPSEGESKPSPATDAPAVTHSTTAPAQQPESVPPQATSDKADAEQSEPSHAAPAEATPPQVTLGDFVKEYGADKLHPNTVYVFQYASKLSRALKQPIDSVILLASILYLAESNKKDTGLFLCKLIREEMPQPPRTTRALTEAAARLVLGPTVKIKTFPERPGTNSREWQKMAVDDELRFLFEKALYLSLSSNMTQQVQPRHIIAACLLADTFTQVNYRLFDLFRNLDSALDSARSRLAEFIATEHKKSEKAEEWRSFFHLKPEGVSEATEQTEQKAEAPVEPETEVASVLHASVSDQPVSVDSLGFEPYVTAMAEFLTNPQTVPPLTLSIEGEWGSGKSSFMLQLRDKLRDIAADKEVKCPTVQFNAWRHDKEDALWASFAIEFVRQLKRQLSRRARLRAHLWLLVRRFKWADGLPALLRVCSLTLVYAFFTLLLVYVLSSGGLESLLVRKPAEKAAQASQVNGQAAEAAPVVVASPVGAAMLGTGLKALAAPEEEFKPEVAFLRLAQRAGVIGYLALTIFFAIKLKDFLGNPLAANLRQYVDAPDYNSRVAFIEHFHEDFKKIVETYAGRNKVYVFIDDLDRCDVPKAADLMQALNLMIADSPQIIFIIGMDREKVAAGLAVKYAELLPYISPVQLPIASAKKKAAASGRRKESEEEASPPPFNPTSGLEYGYSFIEKFIQLPFRIPQPGDDDVRRFLDTFSETFAKGGADATASAQKGEETATERPAIVEPDQSSDAPRVNPKDAPRVTAGVTPPPTPVAQEPLMPERQEKRRKFKLEAFNDSPEIREIVMGIAPALDSNPRRMKQFINLFRLNAYIAAETSLNEKFTLQQLGKFVALGLRWPRLLSQLEDDSKLLRELQDLSLKPDSTEPSQYEAANFWRQRPELLRLLRYGCAANGANGGGELSLDSKYSLGEVNVTELLRVSARVVRTHPTPVEGQTGNSPARLT